MQIWPSLILDVYELWIELLIDLSFYANFPAHIICIISQYPRRGREGISSNQWEVSCCRVSEYNTALWPLKSGVSRDLKRQCTIEKYFYCRTKDWMNFYTFPQIEEKEVSVLVPKILHFIYVGKPIRENYIDNIRNCTW